MKVRALLLGYFFDQNPFYVYHIEGSDILLFKLADISLLFNVPHLPRHSFLATDVLSTSPDCYRDAKDLYLSTKLLGETAVSLNKYLLAEFCKLKPNDYGAGLADSILNAVSRFERVTVGDWIPLELPIASSADGVASSSEAPVPAHATPLPSTTDANSNSVTGEDPPVSTAATVAAVTPHLPRSNTADNASQNGPKSPQLHQVKTEPLSPSFVPASPGASHGIQDQQQHEEQSNNPMALDKVLSNVNGSRRRSGYVARKGGEDFICIDIHCVH
ncbi:hypothetical protein BX666DRAFT_1987889 [Dichotomocladium elegans]|nr:hypothetical protein BX666DRAFT_1987889 [Dichotomocladium elegans]